jgi:hypothetical protein
MKRLVTTLGVCLAIGVGAAAQQQQQQQQADPQAAAQAQKPATQELTLTGCLVQGSTPTVFVFDKARKDPKSPTEKPVKYIVVAGTEDLNFRQHLNHEVQIVGTWDGRTAPATGKVEEKDLPRFTAKSVTMVADTCTPLVR